MKRRALNRTIFAALNLLVALVLMVHQQWFWTAVSVVVIACVQLYVDHIVTQRYYRRRDILYRYLALTHSYLQWQWRELPELQKIFGTQLTDIWHKEMDEELRRLSSVYCEDVLRPHMNDAFRITTDPGPVQPTHPVFERL